MTFATFTEMYREDLSARIKENTLEKKNNIINNKLIPCFGKKKMCDIQPKDIIAWQNKMMNYCDENGKNFPGVSKNNA